MCSLICWCPQLRQAVWQHLPGCSAHLRLWGWSHEAWEMQGTQTRVRWGLVEETPGISHYFERVRKICPTLCRQSIRDCCEPQRFRLFLSKPCALLIQMTVYPMPCTQAGLITGCFLPRAHLLIMVSQRSTPTLSSSSRFHSSFRSIGCGLNT